MLRDDQEVEQVLLALARLALVSEQPFVLCIDQVDNLDPDKLKPLARFLHALLDHAVEPAGHHLGREADPARVSRRRTSSPRPPGTGSPSTRSS